MHTHMYVPTVWHWLHHGRALTIFLLLHPYEGRSVGKFCTCIRCATIGSASGVMSTRRLRPKGEVWMEHAANVHAKSMIRESWCPRNSVASRPHLAT